MAHQPAGDERRDASARPQIDAQDVGLHFQLQGLLQRFELTPIRVTALYLVFGFVAIYVSDVLLVRVFEEPLVSRLQAVKGIAEVLLTGVLLFALTRGSRAPLEITNERLSRQREELEVLHRVLRHNLRNDLTAIRGYTELICEKSNGETAEWCQTVQRRVSALHHYTEQASRINRISRDGGAEMISTDLTEVVHRVVNENGFETNGVDLALDLPARAPVRANHMLETAIQQLITNAIEHSDSSAPEITISVDHDPGFIGETRLEITDDGPGLHEHALAVLEQESEEPLLHMKGLGLWMVHWIVSASQGAMDIETGDDGTRIRITLPSGTDAADGSIPAMFG